MKTSLRKQREQDHKELLLKAADHRRALENVDRRIGNVEQGIQASVQTSNQTLRAISSDVQATKAEIMNFRSVKQRIMGFVNAFPLEIRDLLQKILQSDWQVYQLLLSIQRSLAQAPTQILDSNIQFEDPMGDLISLPYVYFRHWEVGKCLLTCVSYKQRLRRDRTDI